MARLAGKKQLILLVVIALLAFQFGRCTAGGDGGHGAHQHAAGEDVIWTCSMHPQIRLEEFGQCPICFMDLIPASEGGSVEDRPEWSLELSESAKKLSRIVTAPVERRHAGTTVRLSGRITADEGRVGVISSRIEGRIDRLIVNETGTTVRSGAPLAVLYSPELMTLQQELISAAGSVARLGDGASDVVRESAKRNFEAAQEKLRLLGFSQAELDSVLDGRHPAEHMTIRSAQAGVVLERRVSQGDYVREGTVLFSIADLSSVWAILDAYEMDLTHLRVGQTIEFTVGALPGETFRGRVSFIDPVIDPVTRTARVRVVAGNQGGRLKPGMFLRAVVTSVPSHVAGTPLLIPATAPLFTGERAIVYVEVPLEDGGYLYEGREVILGSRAGDAYIVRSGLEEGERVVAYGAFRIDSDLQIRGKPGMMSPEGGAPVAGHAHHGDHDHSHEEAHTAAEPRQLEPSWGGGTDLFDPDVASDQVSAGSHLVASLESVYAVYFALGQALADDSQSEARRALGQLQLQLLLDRAEGNDDAGRIWGEAKEQLRVSIGDAYFVQSLESIRTDFEDISSVIIRLNEVFGHSEGTHYVAYCPMAFDNAGAYWLQRNDDTIANPYFGASMLRCGEIRKTVEAGQP